MTEPRAAATPLYQAAMFQFPGRPLPLARRLAVYNRLMQTLRHFMRDEGFNEIPVPTAAASIPVGERQGQPVPPSPDGDMALTSQVGQHFLGGMIRRGFPAVWCQSESASCDWAVDTVHRTGYKLLEAERKDLDLAGLCTMLETLLKTVTAHMSADLLGGRQVTRLDRVIHSDHPRLTYRQALTILETKGWSIPFGGDLHLEADATLSRHCGNLPVLVTHYPTDLKFSNTRISTDDAAVSESVEYILPYAGFTMDGSVRGDAPTRAGFGLSLARLLQYLMGLESVNDAVIHPLAMTGGGPHGDRPAAETI